MLCPFKAYFISEAWMKTIKNEEITDLDFNEIKKFNLKFDKMYTEVPIEITVNPLTRLFLTQHEKSIRKTLDAMKPNDMGSNLSRTVKNMGDSLDELNNLILALHDNKKTGDGKANNNANLVDFMGILLKG